MTTRRLLVMLFAVAPTLGAQTLLTGLVGHWSFDEGGGTAVADSSGQGNHGTLLNGGSAWIPGTYGNALYFPGTTGIASTRVEIPNTPTLQNAITTTATYSAWVRVDDIARDAPILAKEGPGGLSFWFGTFGLGAEGASPGNFGLLLDTGGGQPWTLADRNQGNITQGVWVHLATTWDGSQVTHYLNGSVVAGGGFLSSPISPTTEFMAIGANAGYVTTGIATAFKGGIDDLYLFNRALSSIEVVQLMNGVAIPEPSTATLFTAGLVALGIAAWRRKRAGA